MRGGNDGVDVSEEEESSNERVDPLGLCFRKLLLDQSTCGLAQPPDAKGNLSDCLLQLLEDLQHEPL